MMAAVCLQAVAQDEFLTSVAPGNKYAFISCSNNIGGYVMYADGAGAIRVGNPDNYSITDPNCQFEFESTDQDGWLYLKNVGTGEYFQQMATQSGVNLPLGPSAAVADTTFYEGDRAVPGEPVSEIALDQWFMLKGAGSYPYWVYVNEDGVLSCTTELPEYASADYAFRFVQVGDKVLLQTYGGKYVGRSDATTDDETLSIPVDDADYAAAFTYEMIDVANGQVRLASDNNETVCFLHLQNTNVCYWSGNGPQSQFIMTSCTTEAMPEFSISYTYAEKFQAVIANGDQIWLKTPSGQHVNMYFGNPQNDGVTYWTGSGDASRWHIVLVEEGGDPHEQLKALMDAAQKYMDLKEHAGEVGYYTEEAYDVLSELFETLSMEYDPEICTDDDARYYISMMDEAMKTFLASGVVFPEDGKFYRLRNTVTGEYAAMTDLSSYTTTNELGDTVVCGCGIMLPGNEADPRQVWRVQYSDEGYIEIYNAFSGFCADNTDPLTGFSTEPTTNWELFNNTGEGFFQIHIKTSYYNNFNLREYVAAGEPDAEADRATQAIKLYTYSSWSTTYWVFEECEVPEYDTADWTYNYIGYYADRAAYLEAHTRYPEFGAEDNSADWWTAFSDYYTLSPGNFITFKFYNYSDKAENWHNWVLVAANAQRDAEGYQEYFALRNDNYGWTAGADSIPDYYATGTLTSAYDWTTFRDDMDGSNVEMTVAYNADGTLDVVSNITTAAGKVYPYSFVGVSGLSGNITLFLTTEKGHVSQVGPVNAIRSISSDAGDAAVYDLFGRRVSDLQRGTIYVKSGKKFMLK